MNTENFINNFLHLVNAPEGPMRLREIILQLAFYGDLTIRDSRDGHALAVFDSNQKAKAEWVSEGIVRKQPALNRLSAAEHPWEIPETWLWCRLGEVTTYGSTDKAEFADATPETWVLELEDIEKDTSRLLTKVRAKERRFRSSKNRFTTGDVLYGKLRPYLDKVVIADEDGVCTTEIIPITIYSGILPEYLRWFLKSPFFKAYASSSTHGMNLPRMGTEAGRNAVFPLAPLAEQKRIVAKVNELMALCDQLETQQQERKRLFPVLSRTCHARFAEAPTPANLNRIFDETGTVSPNDLRTTILTLGIQGKLLPQDLGDESVDDLLSRIYATKARLQSEGMIGKEKSLKNVQTRSMPFVVPQSWRWVKLFELTELITKGSSPKWQGINYVPESNGVLFITSENVGNYKLRKLQELKYVDSRFNEIEPRSMLKRGDILINLVGASIGRAALYDLADGANINQAVALIRLVRETEGIEPSFLLHYFNSPAAIDCMLASRVVNAQPNISLTDAREFPVPLPPLAEQRRIVTKVDELMALVNQLETQQQERDNLAEAFAKACVASFTGNTAIERPEKMKAPKTELISLVTLGKKPNPDANAPLAQLLIQSKGTLSAKSLWQQSNYSKDISAFYQQLKSEIDQGWIAPPAEAEMKILEEA